MNRTLFKIIGVVITVLAVAVMIVMVRNLMNSGITGVS